MQSNAAGKRIFSSISLATGFLVVAVATALHAAPAASSVDSLRVPFVANQGQVDSRVSYYARTFAGTLFVTTEGRLVYSLAGGRRPARVAPPGGPEPIAGWTLSESFAEAPATPVGLRPAMARVSSFVGPTALTRSDLPTYESVGLGEIGPGISLELRAAGNNVEKLFQVAPGADVERIRVRIEGAEHLSLAGDGSLVVGTGLGDIQFTVPIAYQEHGGKQIMVPAKYILTAAGEYGFAVGAYDRALPLTIDPLLKSTYSGGNGEDSIRAMQVHPGSGDVYVAGSTTSTNFPGTAGAQIFPGTDAFVARYNATLTTLLHASYYGGDGIDIAYAIAILPDSGDIYIAGQTFSATGLPNISGTLHGTSDAFIARFNGALNAVNATYYGGGADDTAWGLAIDNITGDIIVTGDTNSTDLTLGTGGAEQASPGGSRDGFIARFSANLGMLVRATYFGGSGADRIFAVALDPLTGDIVVAGITDSTNLPGTANGALPANGGLADGFVARLDGGLTTLRQSTYFGGTADDQINAVAIHPLNGRIYVAGETTSADLRGKPAGQLTAGGSMDAFVARFHQDLIGLQAVSYFGSVGDEAGNALAISKYSGEVYVGGYSASGSLPGTGFGIQEANAGLNDAFVVRFDAGLLGVKQATFIGGSGSDFANAIALTDSAVYIAGETASATLGGTAPGGAQKTLGGGARDGFISALGTDLRLGNSNPAAFSFAAIANALPSSVQTSAPAQVMPTGDAIAYVDGQPGSTWCASSAPNCSCNLSGNDFTSDSRTLNTTAPNPYYICVRHTASSAPNVITESTMHIGTTTATFRVGTGVIPGFGCTLDVDGNGAQNALTDGLLVLRALFGLTGTAVTNGAVGANALRSEWSDISTYLNTNCGGSFAP